LPFMVLMFVSATRRSLFSGGFQYHVLVFARVHRRGAHDRCADVTSWT
jgi:hypothetical protein